MWYDIKHNISKFQGFFSIIKWYSETESPVMSKPNTDTHPIYNSFVY